MLLASKGCQAEKIHRRQTANKFFLVADAGMKFDDGENLFEWPIYMGKRKRRMWKTIRTDSPAGRPKRGPMQVLLFGKDAFEVWERRGNMADNWISLKLHRYHVRKNMKL